MLIPLLYLKLDHTPTISCLYYLNEWPRVCYPIFDMNCYVWGKSVAALHRQNYYTDQAHTQPQENCDSGTMNDTAPSLLAPIQGGYFSSPILIQPTKNQQETLEEIVWSAFCFCAFWSEGWQTQQIFINSVTKYLHACTSIYGQADKRDCYLVPGLLQKGLDEPV